MDNGITLTQLSKADFKTLIREELECFFANKVDIGSDDGELGGIELAMEITGLAKATIYTRVSSRTIPHRKRGKKLYFSRRELTDWIEAGRRKTRAEIASGSEHLEKTETL